MYEVMTDDGLDPADACHLCGNRDPLRESHIIPKFVFRWQKETSPTGYLRSGLAINRRIQDGLKTELLCQKCESFFSKFENVFRNKVFEPATKKIPLNIRYENWMPMFCASVAWRSVRYLEIVGALKNWDAQSIRLIKSAENNWREYLLGRKQGFNDNPLHFIDLWRLQELSIEALPGNWNRFLNRHCSIRPYLFTEPLGDVLFLKMGPVGVFAFLSRPRTKPIGTLLSSSKGSYASNGAKLSNHMFQIVVDEANKHLDVVERTSGAQRDVIAQSILGDINKTAGSAAFEELLSDVMRTGPRAFLKDKI